MEALTLVSFYMMVVLCNVTGSYKWLNPKFPANHIISRACVLPALIAGYLGIWGSLNVWCQVPLLPTSLKVDKVLMSWSPLKCPQTALCTVYSSMGELNPSQLWFESLERELSPCHCQQLSIWSHLWTAHSLLYNYLHFCWHLLALFGIRCQRLSLWTEVTFVIYCQSLF